MSELTVHLRVNDAATGKPTPVRICIHDDKGIFFAPLGRHVEIPLSTNEAIGGQVVIGKLKWFYIDGQCEISLPTGVNLRIEIAKGILYTPVSQNVTLGPGQMTLRFTIEKKHFANDYRFVDTRAHYLTPHDALLEACAEGLDSVQLLIRENLEPALDGKLYMVARNLSAFSGQHAALKSDDCEVVVNTFNAHPALGKLALLNSHRPVFPLTSGEDSDDWLLSDWCDQCHRKKGFVVWVDALTEPVRGGEALINTLLGKVDAIELDGSPTDAARMKLCYHLWNLGIPIPIVGGSAKNSNRIAIGSYRTGVKLLPDDEDGNKWRDFEGRGTLVTTGPVIHEEYHDGYHADGSYVVRAESLTPFDSLEVIHNGDSIAKKNFELIQGVFTAELTVHGKNHQPGWLAARVTGKVRNSLYDTIVFAHTSPVVTGSKELGLTKRTQAAEELRPMLVATKNWIEGYGRFRGAKSRQLLLDLCAQAFKRLDVS